jgi:hypothetical protein
MKYLFAFGDEAMCSSLRRALKKAGITCEIRKAHEFPQGNQGPELWVCDEDYDKAKKLFTEILGER